MCLLVGLMLALVTGGGDLWDWLVCTDCVGWHNIGFSCLGFGGGFGGELGGLR